MTKLEIFKYNLRFQSWGELYLGCKAKWITPQDVVCFYENNKVKAKEEDFVSLSLALKNGERSFILHIRIRHGRGLRTSGATESSESLFPKDVQSICTQLKRCFSSLTK